MERGMRCVLCFALSFLLPLSSLAATPDPLAAAATWHPPKPEEVKAQALDWSAKQPADDAAKADVETIWRNLPAAATEDELFRRLTQTFARIDPNAAQLAAVCSRPRDRLALPKTDWLRGEGVSPRMAANLRLLYAEWLVQESLFDEALDQLSGLSTADVAAPAALLFHQSVVHHALLNKEAGLKIVDALLSGAEFCPQRYATVARLMREDLRGLQDDTLDHIARRMGDIRRRLDLGRAGPKVRKEQEDVVKSLDKLIKKLEDEMQRQLMGATLQPGSPMPDSKIAGGSGPGEVTRKHIGSESGWGALPPKERDEAMQQIGRDFPSHYRDAIEQYFRRLAAEESEPK
jgi:hypothetical protein